jgi:hypothetical protein
LKTGLEKIVPCRPDGESSFQICFQAAAPKEIVSQQRHSAEVLYGHGYYKLQARLAQMLDKLVIN